MTTAWLLLCPSATVASTSPAPWSVEFLLWAWRYPTQYHSAKRDSLSTARCFNILGSCPHSNRNAARMNCKRSPPMGTWSVSSLKREPMEKPWQSLSQWSALAGLSVLPLTTTTGLWRCVKQMLWRDAWILTWPEIWQLYYQSSHREKYFCFIAAYDSLCDLQQ